MKFKKASLVLAATLIASLGATSVSFAAEGPAGGDMPPGGGGGGGPQAAASPYKYAGEAAQKHEFSTETKSHSQVVLKLLDDGKSYGEAYTETKATDQDYINSPSASSNIVAIGVYDTEGKLLETIEASNGGVLTMVKLVAPAAKGTAVDIIDLVESQEKIDPNNYFFYETAGSEVYSEMAKFGSMGGNTAQYTYRSALKIVDDALDATESMDALYTASKNADEDYDVTGSLSLDAPFINGIIVDDTGDDDSTTKVNVKNASITAKGDGANDFQGEAAAVLAQGEAEVDISDTTIFTEGVIRTAAAAKENGILKIDNSVVYAEETNDTNDEYNALVVPMMKRTPFALGIEGVVRTTNVLGSGQGIYTDSLIASSGWGVLSTDSGTSYAQTGTYALDVKDVVAGIGTVEVYNAAHADKYTATREVNGVKYGFIQGGSGYVAYADSGVYDRFSNVSFYSDDYVQIMASNKSSAFYSNSELTAGRIAVMTQQNNGGKIKITDSTVNVGDTAVQVKSGAANAGYTDVVLDNADVNFTEDNKWGGTLVELVESDDAGNPGVTEYTINDSGDTATSGAAAIAGDTNVKLTGDNEYTGNIWNNIYNKSEALNLVIDGSTSLTGTISSAYGYHVDKDGKRVANGTKITCNTEGDYRTSKTETGEYKMIGAQYNVANEQINNPVNVDLRDSATWNISLADGTNGEAKACYINDLTVAKGASIQSDEKVTIYYYGDLNIAEGASISKNITFKKSEVKANEKEDDGIALETQFYDGTPLTIMVQDENGKKLSKAVTISGQAFTNYRFNATVADGYTIKEMKASDGITVGANTADTDYAYAATITGSNVKSGTITIIVKATSEAKANQTITLANTSVKKDALALTYGKKASLKASAKGAITYTSSNSKVASVSSKGVVTAKKAGTATITIKAAGTDQYNAATKSIKVTVKKATNAVSLKTTKLVVKAKLAAKKTTKKTTASLKATAKYGKVNFYKVAGSKKITISKAGKVTVAKGTKAGTYKVKVKVKAKYASGKYTTASKVKTVKVVVKKK